MKSSRFSSLFFLLAVACGAPSTVATRPTPTAPPAAAPSAPAVSQPASVPPVTLAEAPRNWQLLDEGDRSRAGHQLRARHERAPRGEGAQEERCSWRSSTTGSTRRTSTSRRTSGSTRRRRRGNQGRRPQRATSTTFTAGTSSAARTGKDVHFDTFEVTREYARCHGGAAASGSPQDHDAARCTEIDAAFEKQRNSIQSSVTNYKGALDVLHQIMPLLKQAVAPDTLSLARVRALSPSTPQLTQARQIYLQLAAGSERPRPCSATDSSRSRGSSRTASTPTSIRARSSATTTPTGTEHHYGNSDVMGQDAKHGTHVAGIIGAVRGNGIGVDGIAPAVTFMMIRTVPDGDERDKDVANAIRYAVDNGAQIISMSFGKAYSPYKAAVDDAVKYADAHGVLMVHAAGNDGEDLGKAQELPQPDVPRRRTPDALDRGGRVVMEGRRQTCRPSSRTTASSRSTCSRRALTSSRRCREISTSVTAARAWPHRS